ncbi:MAG: DUF4249 domain-containing protein [Flavobacteriales bacterium]|jgi:hypothetical protein|nr:DUF4249 domain-containing protein [Flavobacteriales bacterium]
MKKLLPLLAVAFSLVSCEEIVDINLHDGNQQVVVNAQFATDKNKPTMTLSTTGRFTDGAGIGPASDFIVSITDQNGNTAVLNETTAGRYRLTNYGLSAGNTYTLSATDGTKTISATSTVQAKAVIDSVRLELIQFSDFEFTIVHIYTVDPAPEANYLRSRLNYNHQGFSNFGNVMADVLNANGVMDMALAGGPFLQGDTLTIELWSMDEAGYQFYRTLNQAANSDPSSTASPFNVTSNVVGGFGLFEVYERDEYTLIVD